MGGAASSAGRDDMKVFPVIRVLSVARQNSARGYVRVQVGGFTFTTELHAGETGLPLWVPPASLRALPFGMIERIDRVIIEAWRMAYRTAEAPAQA